jgi:hypothetical protein
MMLACEATVVVVLVLEYPNVSLSISDDYCWMVVVVVAHAWNMFNAPMKNDN